MLAWNLFLNFWDTSRKQGSDGSDHHQQILRSEVFIQPTNQPKLLLARARRGKQWKPHHPTDHVPCCSFINMKWEGNSTGKQTTSYFQKSNEAFISCKNIFSLLQAPKCLCFIKGSKVVTEENQNNLPYWQDLSWSGSEQTQSFTPMQTWPQCTSIQFLTFYLSKLSKKHKVQFLICFPMEWTVMVEKRKSLGWKDWQLFGQATSHWTHLECAHI